MSYSEVKQGALAVCGHGDLGIITESEPRTEGDDPVFRWFGTHLAWGGNGPGTTWSSQMPVVLGRVESWRLERDANGDMSVVLTLE